jgi:hypothetical protein
MDKKLIRIIIIMSLVLAGIYYLGLGAKNTEETKKSEKIEITDNSKLKVADMDSFFDDTYRLEFSEEYAATCDFRVPIFDLGTREIRKDRSKTMDECEALLNENPFLEFEIIRPFDSAMIPVQVDVGGTTKSGVDTIDTYWFFPTDVKNMPGPDSTWELIEFDRRIFADGFESDPTSVWSTTTP